MNTQKSWFTKNLWKLALAIGLIIAAIAFWNRAATPAPAIAQPTIEAEARLSEASTQLPTAARQVNATQNAEKASLTNTTTPAPPTATPTEISVFYQVESGDIPLAIAAEFDITVEELLEANNISDPTLLQIGQKLRVPVTVTPSPTAPTPTPTPADTPTPTPEPIYHTVQSGDTLLAIAKEYDTNADLILIVNNIVDPRLLSIGQELLIPSGDIEVEANVPTLIHQIKSGDTIGYLSFFYGSTVDDILAANPGLEPRFLQIGDKVIIPVTSPPINPDANPALPQVITPKDMLPKLAALQVEMVNKVNTQRQGHGLPSYQPNLELSKMALAHAQDMVDRGYFAHTTPEGVALNDRFQQQGIAASWTGENIQRNVKPLDITVAEAVRWFMNSAPHRANILHNRFEQIGVGVAEGPSGWYTFVLVFAKR